MGVGVSIGACRSPSRRSRAAQRPRRRGRGGGGAARGDPARGRVDRGAGRRDRARRWCCSACSWRSPARNPLAVYQRDVPRLVRDLVLVPEHAAAGGAADADGAGDRAAAAPRPGGAGRRGGDGAGRAGGGGGGGAHPHADVGEGRRCWSSGALVGGLWMAIAGALRAYRGVNETISTLLLNYIAIALLNHLVEGPLRDPASLNKPSTLPIGDDNMLGKLPGPGRALGARPGASARACSSGSSCSGRRSASPRAWWAATSARRCSTACRCGG